MKADLDEILYASLLLPLFPFLVTLATMRHLAGIEVRWLIADKKNLRGVPTGSGSQRYCIT
ncbi:hypothetical protein GYMLUDRAFT_689529 [Collybiopsis luxurians FD-317 M1]|uniref:Uncharacterized protein n=1 Tax=Collybiopsis luxurians FD-317 M1 TaxID=944289 RepID=A0A0D0CJX1_9AGAR|nr:hypothetical protein GYMLUDRAFT_689529 [Collybiopsis luxurians FD-317 M1]